MKVFSPSVMISSSLDTEGLTRLPITKMASERSVGEGPAVRKQCGCSGVCRSHSGATGKSHRTWSLKPGCGSILTGAVPSSQVRFHLHRCGSILTGAVPSSQVRFHSHRCGSILTGAVPSSQVRFHPHRCGSILTGAVPFSQVRFHLHRCGSILTGAVPFSQVRFHLHRCGSILTGVVPSSQVRFHPHRCGSILTGAVPFSQVRPRHARGVSSSVSPFRVDPPVPDCWGHLAALLLDTDMSGSLRQFLESHCPIVTEKFCPTFWCHGGRLQTIVRVMLASKPHVSYRNEVISTDDGGQISLDWIDNDESSQFPDSASRPTIILLPGLTGNSQQSYILHLVSQACSDGYRCVVFNNRGFGGEKLLTHRTFCAANTEDLSRVVSHVYSCLPAAPLVAVGVSIGGMLLLNYLAATGQRSQLCAALVFSTPWNVFVSTASLEQPLNYRLFNRSLVITLRDTVNKFRDIIGKVLDVDHILQSRSIREFDERYTSVVFGYGSCDEYYRNASPHDKLQKIKTPVMCLNAADDPFSPSEAFPLDEASSHPYVALLVLNHGGHIGFLEGPFPHHQRYMNRAFSQFVGATLLQHEELKNITGNGLKN
ncbi:protein ABHD1 isoform X4 [Ranitomeya imitator]|uniref:protein ABHD1 isoform X4 n=1 Tax=Ranitomeya imitator TaxID=111125 RepID=UPI0037E7B3FF